MSTKESNKNKNRAEQSNASRYKIIASKVLQHVTVALLKLMLSIYSSAHFTAAHREKKSNPIKIH